MNLPDYFIADLPPEATFTPTLIVDACEALKRNREQYLFTRPLDSIIRVLGHLGEEWRKSDYPFRQLALEKGPEATGFSRETLAAGLDSFFSELTPDHIVNLIEQDLGHKRRLEAFASSRVEEHQSRSSIVSGPQLLVHIASGNLPLPAMSTMVLGLLARSAQFVKLPQGTSLLARLFAHSLYQIEPKLAACIEVAEWPRTRTELDQVLLKEADCVMVTGSDEAVASVRGRVGARKRFLGYGHRVSFGYVGRDRLSGIGTNRLVSAAARDVAAWDQNGCLSPHVIYVEFGGTVTPLKFAELLAEELEAHEQKEPRGKLLLEESAVITNRRLTYEIRASGSDDTRLWHSRDSTAWTVVYESNNRFTASCLNRFVYVKGVESVEEALQGADSIQHVISTVGIAVEEDREQTLATQLARWGASRICPLGRMQKPPLAWRHDGRPALADLVTWTDWER